MAQRTLGEKYDEIAAWWIDAQMKHPGYCMSYVRKAMKYAKRSSAVLDIGCGGTGRVIEELLRHEFSVTGLDASSEMIRRARLRHPEVRFVHGDFLEWETGKTFDLMIALDSIFHVPRILQKQATIKMCRLLKPEGVLLFTAGAHAGSAQGEMNGVDFEYGSIGYRAYLDILEKEKCGIILMEEDQYPAGHMVFICQKNASPEPDRPTAGEKFNGSKTR